MHPTLVNNGDRQLGRGLMEVSGRRGQSVAMKHNGSYLSFFGPAIHPSSPQSCTSYIVRLGLRSPR